MELQSQTIIEIWGRIEHYIKAASIAQWNLEEVKLIEKEIRDVLITHRFNPYI